MSRDETIAAIRANLKRRSRLPWSVTGGNGTSWGWIEIHIAPRLRAEYGYLTDEHRAELARLLGLDTVHSQGVSIPASSAHYREFLARSAGESPAEIAQAYWD